MFNPFINKKVNDNHADIIFDLSNSGMKSQVRTGKEEVEKSIYTSWIALDQQTWMKFALGDLDHWLKLSLGTLFAILCNKRRAGVGPEDCKRQTLNQF